MFCEYLKKPLFYEFDDESTEFLYNLVVVEGWSLTYSLRFFAHKKKLFDEAKKTNVKLRIIEEFYNEKVRHKQRLGYAND